MFVHQSSDFSVTQIPYRARYKISFEGSQENLKSILLDCLKNLQATFLNKEKWIQFNPTEDRYEVAVTLNEGLELFLLAYWSNYDEKSIEVTFDLDSPIPIEVPIDEQFLNPAKHYFPNVRLVYNFLHRPKVTVRKSENREGILKNHQWMKTHRQEYRGRWIALLDGELLADASSVDELLQQVTLTPNTLITAIY